MIGFVFIDSSETPVFSSFFRDGLNLGLWFFRDYCVAYFYEMPLLRASSQGWLKALSLIRVDPIFQNPFEKKIFFRDGLNLVLWRIPYCLIQWGAIFEEHLFR